MRTIFFLFLVSSMISCNQQVPLNDSKESAKVDTSYYFIKRILNCSPQVISSILGKPDNGLKPTNDCGSDDMPNCYNAQYQNNKYDVLYYHDRLKSIIVSNTTLAYDETAIQSIGFQKCEATFKGQQLISWRGPTFKGNAAKGPLIPIKGIEEINLAPGDKGNGTYLVVVVETNYNNKL